MSGLFSTQIIELVVINKIKFHECRTISSGASFLRASLNQKGFSEDWDSGGLFSPIDKTAYIASDGWDGDSSYTFTEYDKRITAAHEIGGHGVDLCLGKPSEAKEFQQAWEHDLRHSYLYPEDSEADKLAILGVMMDSKKGPAELWATFMEFALTGTHLVHSACHFPECLSLFNKNCLDLGIPFLNIVKSREWIKSDGKIIDVVMPPLNMKNPSFIFSSCERPAITKVSSTPEKLDR